MATKTKVNIRPLGDRVLIQRAEAEDKTAGGILLPESAKDSPRRARSWRWARAPSSTASASP